MQEGALGLMRAVDGYDWRRDVTFSTHAAWWIRHAIVRAPATAGQSMGSLDEPVVADGERGDADDLAVAA